jgi:hypothetical protein
MLTDLEISKKDYGRTKTNNTKIQEMWKTTKL